MTSTCKILNSFGNKGIYCQAMSGNEYNTAEETGPGDVRIDGRMFLTPCPVRSASSFFPFFHRKKKLKEQQKESRALWDGYFFLSYPCLFFILKT